MPFRNFLKVAIGSLAAHALLASAGAQTSGPVGLAAHPTIRVTGQVNNSVRTQVVNSRPGFVANAVVGARVASSKPLAHLQLMLNSSDEQEAALQQLMAEQQDKSSPNFHKWLTPEIFGTYFGPAQSDIAKVTAWLADQGFSVEGVSRSGRFITFSGTVGQVETAFQTEIRTLTVNGELHASNTTDISVPAAFQSVVAGITRLNDVRPKHVGNLQGAHSVQLDGASTTGTPTPLYGTSTGTHYVTPGDLAIIDNVTPLTTAGLDGTGQTVAVIGQTNVDLADVQKFRSMFGLTKKDPTVTLVDQDPGLNPDDGEAYLDLEWSGALAQNANINFIVSSPNYFYGGVDAAALYAVENNIGDTISLSYGGCEYLNGATYTAYWNSIWEQAAAQGQTVFVSSGDSGAAGCSSSGATYATQQGTAYGTYSVNALGSSAYNVAMGGSIFVDFGQATYWGTTGTTIPFVNALSYIPEAALNQSRLAPTYLNSGSTAYQTGSGVFAAGGGVSIYTSRPSWQTGSGIPTGADVINLYSPSASGATGLASGNNDGTHRLVPDLVNISANGHDGTLYCASSLCSTSASGTLNNAGIVGGTSVATPVQAGIQALINQKNGGRQGNILPILYKLANTQYTASTTACQAGLGSASATATLPASTCNFHDVVGGSITVPYSSTGTTGVGFLAGAGFDEASGLGSMNVTNVANNWTTVGLAATTTKFTLSPTINITHGTAQTLKVTVAATSGSGTPTGDVSLVAETSTPNGPRVYTLTSGAYSGPVGNTVSTDGSGDTLTSALPAGSYNVHVHYAGDTTYAPSDSASIAVSINKEASTTSTVSYSIDPSTLNYTAAATFTYGASAIYLQTAIAGNSATGVPTGTVVYAVKRNGTSLTSLTVNVDGNGQTYFYSGFAYPSYYLLPNYAPLIPGTYVITATYSGDKTFNSSSSTTTITVGQASPTVTFTGPTNIASGAQATYAYQITQAGASTTAPTTTALATGTVMFTDTTTGTALGSCTLSSGACSFQTTAITATGANIIQAVYGGDTNYTAATSTFTTTVGTGLTSSTLTLTGAVTTSATVGYVYTLKATLAPTAATGTAAFYDSGNFLGTCTLSSGVCSLVLGVSGTATSPYTGGILTAGTHSFTAVYSGSTTYAAATGTLSTTIAQSTTAITLSGPANTTYGQAATYSVYITRTAGTYAAPTIPLTGTVSFTDSVTGTVVATGTPVYDTGGYHYYVAAGTTTALTGGSHTITATYSGDANYKASTSSLTQATTVAALTPTLALSSTTGSNTYASGSVVYLQVLIPAASTQAAPTGAVIFTNVASTTTYACTLSYSATLGGYACTIGLGGLTGTQQYYVTLAADSNYAAATSNTLTVLIETNNVWVANGNNTVSALSNSGAAVTSAGLSGGGTAIAIDNSGNVWSLNKSGSTVAEYSKAGATVSTGSTVGGLNAPSALAIDGAGLVWVANGSGTLSVLSTPTTAVNSTAYSVNASTPTSVNIDGSGNLWITNAGDNSVTEVIGAASPVTTPTTTAVTNNTLAAKP